MILGFDSLLGLWYFIQMKWMIRITSKLYGIMIICCTERIFLPVQKVERTRHLIYFYYALIATMKLQTRRILRISMLGSTIKRKHDNWVKVFKREFEEASQIKGIDMGELIRRCSSLNIRVDMIEVWGKQMVERCALHGFEISLSTKMLSFTDIILENTEEEHNPE